MASVKVIFCHQLALTDYSIYYFFNSIISLDLYRPFSKAQLINLTIYQKTKNDRERKESALGLKIIY